MPKIKFTMKTPTYKITKKKPGTVIIKRLKLLKNNITNFTRKSRHTKLRRNIIKHSYNSRFLRLKRRILYYKTVRQPYIPYTENIEDIYMEYLETNIQKIERRERNKRLRLGSTVFIIPMGLRVYSHTIVFITHCVKNTFVTVFRGPKSNVLNQFNVRVITKGSCGLLGYKGPKKNTTFARKEVIKYIGNYLGDNAVSLLSVVFTSKVSRWNRKSVRNLVPNLSYVVSVTIQFTRSHGQQKQRNAKRK